MSNYTYQANKYKENITQLNAILDKVGTNINLISTYLQENPKSLMVDVSEKLESAKKDINNIKDKSSNVAESLIVKAKKLDEEEINKNNQINNSTKLTKLEDMINNNQFTNTINNKLANAIKSSNVNLKSTLKKSSSNKVDKNRFERIYMD